MLAATLGMICAVVNAQDAKLPVEELDSGIRNGCISTNRIKGTSVIDEKTIILGMRGGDDIEMKFSRRCPGLRFNPIVIRNDGSGRLCEGFDSVRVAREGWTCTIESLTPHQDGEVETEELANRSPCNGLRFPLKLR